MSGQAAPFEIAKEGLRLWVKVQPQARRNGAEGLVPRADGGVALKVALTAPPVDGKANAALTAWLAEAFGLAKRDVAILRGAAQRQKLVLLAGDAEGLALRAESLY